MEKGDDTRGLEFRKSSFSGKYSCVGVAWKDNIVYVQNTKQKEPIVKFTFDEWQAFISGVKAGEFDILDGDLQ